MTISKDVGYIARLRSANGRPIVYGIALATALMASSSAIAQNCSGFASANVTNLGIISGGNAVLVGSITSSITTASTAFLTQSSAFVSAPSNPAPGQQGGGVWVRGVGGQVDVKNNSTGSATIISPGAGVNESPTGSCSNTVSQTFAGVQVGRDLAKLNINGWNLHYGTTAGFLEANSKASDVSFKTNIQVPFAGVYGVATYGRFFSDILIRGDYYQAKVDSNPLNFFNQNINAQGFSVAASAGYNFALQNNWFVEPSVGVIHTKTKVDSINIVGAPTIAAGTTPIAGTVRIDDIESTIGRLGLRVGTTVNYNSWVLQPFASVSVWHDFADGPQATFTACCAAIGVNPATLTQSFVGQNIGTYGQYSLGMSGQLAGTGWLAFGRLDYRDGNRLEGFSGTGGIRYQFSPEMAVAPVITKGRSKGPAMPVAMPTTWGGWYIGANVGAAYGQSHFGTPISEVDPHIGGFIGGVQGGYNWQMGQWVYGIEGDFGGTNVKGGQACGPLTLGDTRFFNTTCTGSSDWVASLTGRIGMTWDRALLYVKGGVAWTDASWDVSCNNGPLNTTGVISPLAVCRNGGGALLSSLSVGDTVTGYAIGFGSEYALTSQWSAKAEYMYMDFGNKNYTAADGTLLNHGMSINVTRVGLNYRFLPN